MACKHSTLKFYLAYLGLSCPTKYWSQHPVAPDCVETLGTHLEIILPDLLFNIISTHQVILFLG